MTLSTKKTTNLILFSLYANKSTESLEEILIEKTNAIKEQKECMIGNKSSSQVELLFNDVSKLKKHINVIDEIIDTRKKESSYEY